MNKMKIIFLGMNSRYSTCPLENIINMDRYEVVAVIEAMPRKFRKKTNIVKEYLWRNTTNSVLKKICKKNNITHSYVKDINMNKIESFIEGLKPDLMCIAGFSQLVKKNILNIAPLGVINMHPSILPKYRGPNPWVWHYYYMEQQGGVTVHFIDAGEDTGDIIYQENFDITLGMTSPQMWDIVLEKGCRLLSKALEDIENNTVTRHKQIDSKESFRARNLKKDEKLIDFNEWNVERVYHFLRGTSSWYRAGLDISEHDELIINRYEKMNFCLGNKLGKVYRDDSGSEFIQCIDGKVYIHKKFNIKKVFKSFIKMYLLRW